MEDCYYRRLRDLREDHDMTQQQVADILHCDRSQYARYERGWRDIPTPLLRKLAKLYNTSIDYILEMTDDPRPYKRIIE